MRRVRVHQAGAGVIVDYDVVGNRVTVVDLVAFNASGAVMNAYFIHADGTFEGVSGVYGQLVNHGNRWFRHAGSAVDRNTLFDGMQLKGADGPPNRGCTVYIEIPEPVFSARMVLV